jgi:hypothetical protein
MRPFSAAPCSASLPVRRLASVAGAALVLLVAGCAEERQPTAAHGSSSSAEGIVRSDRETYMESAPARDAALLGGVAGQRAARPTEGEEMAQAVSPPPAPAPPATAAQPAVGTGAGASPVQPEPAPGAVSMIIRTGDALVEVDSLEPAVAAVRQLAARLGGFVADVSVLGGRDQVRSATLQLRLPVGRFDEAVAGLTPFGHVERVTVQAQDVSEEYVDGSARLANARRLEARLIELLARATGRLADVLAVERELARVREEIERAEGRLRWLRTRSALSTLAVTVHERTPIVGPAPASAPIAEAFRQAWRNFVSVVAGTIAVSGVLVPVGVVALVLARLALAWERRRRAAGSPHVPVPPAPAA